jgi:hypothetical protein
VVIAACDGYDCEKEFRTLFDALQQEFQPVGMFEEWLVVKMAECMWRLRRATRAENGSVRDSVFWTGHRNCDAFIEQMGCEISILTEAEGQLRDSGTLSQKTYEQVRPLVAKETIKNTQSENDAKRVETEIDCDSFLTFIVDRKASLESLFRGASYTEDDRYEDHLAHKSLPPAIDMDSILLYEERMHRQLDWALQRLLQRQEMRMKTGKLPDDLLSHVSIDLEKSKRSQ